MAVLAPTPIVTSPGLSAGYTLKRQRGGGAFGSVWEAETADGRVVAFKSVQCASDIVAANEIRNARMISNLKHPNLLQVEKFWCEHNKLFFVMEMADGSLMDLYDVSTAEFGVPLSAEVVCTYFRQVAEALDFLNAREHTIEGARVGIQHRDIKPGNLLLFGNTVKISDFGLSTRTLAANAPHLSAGTPEYAGPEVFQHRLTDWTDQYSLAVSYCRLRGVTPFQGGPDDFYRDYVRPAPDLAGLRPEERPILARALAPVPQNRWASSIEMMRELLTVIPMKTPTELPDRRNKTRYQCPHHPAVRLVTSGRSAHDAQVVNLSRSGIGLRSSLPVAIGLQVSFLLPETGETERTARLLSAKVVRATRQPDGGWLLGCRLKSPLQDAELDAFLAPPQ